MPKRFLCALAAFAAMLIGGCLKAPPTEPVRITLMHGWGSTMQDHVAMRKIYDGFQQANPDIQLLYDMSPDNSIVLEKANNLLAVNRVPDIISTNGDGNFLANIVLRGKALDLSPYLDEDNDFAASVSEQVRQTWQNEKGNIYTLPDAMEVLGYWYNEDIFRAAGVTEDGTPQSAVKLPNTFEEFWNACDKINVWALTEQNDVVPMMMDVQQSQVFFGARIAANSPQGAEFMQKKREACPKEDLEAAMRDIERAHLYYKGAEPSVNDVRKTFFDGKSAIYFNGVWANVELMTLSVPPNVHCAPYPGEYGQKIAYVSSSSGYVIGNSGSQEKIDACVKFLKYILSEDVQRRIAAETGQVPSNPNITVEWISQAQPTLGSALKECYSAEQKILAFNSVLDETRAGALRNYLAIQSPSDEQKAGLASILVG